MLTALGSPPRPPGLGRPRAPGARRRNPPRAAARRRARGKQARYACSPRRRRLLGNGRAGTGVIRPGEESAQLPGHPVAGRALHARDEGQRNDRADDGGGAGDVGADAAGGFRLLDVPDGRLVAGFLFPPAEADATGRARRGAAGNAAAAVGLAAAAVHPDDVTHVRCGNLLRESRPGQQLLDGLGARGRGARLEPRKRRIDELLMAPHGNGAVATAGEPAADTVHETFLRRRPLDLGLREDDHRFTLHYVRMQLARFADTRLHAAGQSDDRGKGEDALRPDVALVHGGLPSVLSREPQDLARNAAASQQYATAFVCSTVPLQSRFPRPRWERAVLERSKAQSSSRSCEPGGAGGRKSAVLSGSLAAAFRFSRRQALRKRFPRRRAYGPLPRMRCPKRASYSRPPCMAQISDMTCAARSG